MKNILKIAFMIIGTIIGAGFVSGKEIFLFFNNFGFFGIFGLLISMLLISFIVYKVLLIINNNNINSYEEFLNHIIRIKNKNVTNFILAMVNVFLLITFFIMCAAFSSYFKQEFNLPYIFGSIIVSIICFFTFLSNINGIVKMNSILNPIIIFFVIFLGLKISLNIETSEFNNLLCENNFKFTFLVSAIVYSSYNAITLIPILVNLKKFLKDKKQIKIESTIIFCILASIALIIFFALFIVENAENMEIPILFVVNKFGTIFKYVFGIIILIAVFTTAISSGYGFLRNSCKSKYSYYMVSFLICLVSIPISYLGFSSLVKILYPIFGFLGLIQIFFLIIA